MYTCLRAVYWNRFYQAVADRMKSEVRNYGHLLTHYCVRFQHFLLRSLSFVASYIYALGSLLYVNFSLKNWTIFLLNIASCYSSLCLNKCDYPPPQKKKQMGGQVNKFQIADRNEGSLYTKEMYSGIQE